MDDRAPRSEGGSAVRDDIPGSTDRRGGDDPPPFGSDLTRLALLAVLAMTMLVPRLRTPIDLSWDASVYYILGTSLAQGKGYRLLNEPGQIAAIQYPPLLPALVACYQRVLGTADPLVVGWWLSRSYLLIATLYILLVYQLARRYLTPNDSCVVALITLLHRLTFGFAITLYAEIPFALITVLFLLIAGWRDRWWSSGAAALLGVAAFLLRTAGLALLFAWVAEAGLDRRWRRAAARGAVAMVPVVAWQMYIASVRSAPDYHSPAYSYQRAAYQYSNVSYAENIALVDPMTPERGRMSLRNLAGRLYRNVLSMPEYMGEAVMWRPDNKATRNPWWPAPGIRWRWVTFGTLITGYLALAGMVLFLIKHEWLIPAFVAGSIGLICLTPWPMQINRYSIPLTPLLALFVIRLLAYFRQGTARDWSGSWKYVGPVCLISIASMIIGQNAVRNPDFFPNLAKLYRNGTARQVPSLVYDPQEWGAIDACLVWLRTHASSGSVVATTVPHWAYLRTNLKAVMPPMVTDPEEAQRLLDSVPVDYVILDELFLNITERYTEPAILAQPRAWRLVYSPDGRTRLYQRDR